MTTTTTTVRPRGSRRVSFIWIVPALLGVALVALVVNLSQSLPSRDTITIRNPTGVAITVRASGDGTSWLPVGTIDARSTDTVEAVADQGDRWRIRLSAGPTVVGELRRTKAQLDDADWRITIPADATDRIRPGN